MYTRILNLNTLLENKSFFLFGPRATGKTFLINKQLKGKAIVLDLLESDLYFKLSANPENLINFITDKNLVIVIDEIQKIPFLLNEVHRLIEKEKIKFLLTGSSARKLKKDGVNLLAGRAWEARLFPLIYREINNFDLNKYLLYGGLPAVYPSKFPIEELNAYVNTYLQQEIQMEAIVRKLMSFTKFLQIAAITNGQILNFSSIASDVSIPVSTVREYYHILEDTLIGFMLPPWTKSIKRKAISSSKFYFFDLGVRNILAECPAIVPHTETFGNAFEHFIGLELKAYLSYKRILKKLSYWRSKNGQEVDFIIGDDVAIEVKINKEVKTKHLNGLKALAEEKICKKFIIISQDKRQQNFDNISAYFWKDFLKLLWQDKLI